MRLSRVCAVLSLFCLVMGGRGFGQNLYVSDQSQDSIDAVNAQGAVAAFAYTDAFSDPPYYPYGVAADPAGNIYVALSANYGTFGSGAIKEYSPTGMLVAKLMASTSVLPYSVAVGGNGNIYFLASVVGTNQDELGEVAANGTVTQIYEFPLFSNPTNVVLDSAGNVYVADGAAIVKFNAGNQMSTFVTLPYGTWGLAFDSSGNLFATQNYTNISSTLNTVVKISPAGVVSPYASNFDNPQGLAVDPNGNLYVAENDSSTSGGKIVKIQTNGQQTPLASGLFHPQYLAVPPPSAPPSDTPTMPEWALLLLAAALFFLGRPSLAR